MRTLSEKLKLLDKMLEVFQEAAKQRPLRREFVVDEVEPWKGNREFEWVLFERQQMLEAVNVERLSRGLKAAAESDIKRAEQMACGHIDYSQKYALYCTELAMGYTEIRP